MHIYTSDIRMRYMSRMQNNLSCAMALICRYLYTYAYMYIHIYTHTHTHSAYVCMRHVYQWDTCHSHKSFSYHENYPRAHLDLRFQSSFYFTLFKHPLIFVHFWKKKQSCRCDYRQGRILGLNLPKAWSWGAHALAFEWYVIMQCDVLHICNTSYQIVRSWERRGGTEKRGRMRARTHARAHAHTHTRTHTHTLSHTRTHTHKHTHT